MLHHHQATTLTLVRRTGSVLARLARCSTRDWIFKKKKKIEIKSNQASAK